MKEVLAKLDTMEKQNGLMKDKIDLVYKRLFVSNGKTALVEEIKQNKKALEDHIGEGNLVDCGKNRLWNKIVDRAISGMVMGVMFIFILGIQTWIKQF